MLICRKYVIATNHKLFGVNLFCRKFGLCKENGIWQLCVMVICYEDLHFLAHQVMLGTKKRHSPH